MQGLPSDFETTDFRFQLVPDGAAEGESTATDEARYATMRTQGVLRIEHLPPAAPTGHAPGEVTELDYVWPRQR